MSRISVLALVVFALLAAAPVPADVEPHGGMLRYPDVSDSHIVFAYANDLWTVPREGGRATPLASPPGAEGFPRFSPDGRSVAFMGNYDGDRDIYTVPVTGGVPERVTFHPANEQLCGWTPGGDLLFSQNGLAGLGRQTQLFTVSPAGGLPERLPVPYGANGAISPDGRWLAYTPHSRDFRTWKRYRGGMATDVWVYDLENHTATRVTDWEGTDTLPMWHGATLYYLSDAGESHRLNLWSVDPAGGARRQLTAFTEYDVKWPSIGPGGDAGEIVFQLGPELRLLDLASGSTRRVPVTIPGARPTLRPRGEDASELVQAWDVSPTGKRAVFQARGDIWTAPAEAGSPRNLTRTSGAAERYPDWSPDKKWIAYTSDETGEYELYIRPSDGTGEPRRLTEGRRTFYFAPAWSPDSKHVLFADKAGVLRLHTVESGKTVEIDREPWAAPPQASFSHDAAWIAYTKGGDNQLQALWLYEVATGNRTRVTAGMFNDSLPVFDRKGEFLYYQSQRRFAAPVYEDVGTSFVYAGTEQIVAVPLNADVDSPFLSESDEESWDDEDADEEEGDDEEDGDDEGDDDEGDDDEGDDDEGDDDEGDDGKKKGKGTKGGKKKVDPVELDLDGFEARGILLPLPAGRYGNMAVNHKGHLIYARVPLRRGSGKPGIYVYDPAAEPDKREEKKVIEGVRSFGISDDGKKLMVSRGGTFAIVDARAKQKMDKPISTKGMRVEVDPRAEWRQIFHDAWRRHRDFFYVANMHGVDWDAVRRHYAAMLDDCVSRDDVSYVIGEMISELNVGHAYYFGGDTEDQPSETVGLLGCDFELHEGAYRISRIIHGAPWDVDARGPLSQPGIDVREGDYLLAVNGAPLDTGRAPWAAFVGMAGQVVTLTVSEDPAPGENDRQVVVKTLPGESGLRYRAWVEANRRHVEERSDGRVGYIYVPNTGVNGQNELFRQFFGQIDRDALIIDERWNGGGQIPTRFIELLNRPRTNYWARRDGKDWPWPPDSHQGPKCMLINGLAGSGGDAFPWYFRQAGLGKLIGTRTWGGLVGITGLPGLVDGGYTAVPTFGFYETDGTWGVEGHGVDPDIEVIDDPSMMSDGADPQLDAAIDHMLEELRRNPYAPPGTPDPPDRSGMGLPEMER